MTFAPIKAIRMTRAQIPDIVMYPRMQFSRVKTFVVNRVMNHQR